MPDLYKHTDYRAYWREWFEDAKKEQSFLSFRYMSKKTGIDAGYLAHVFQSSKHIAESSIDAVIDLLRLKGRDAKYFHELVLFSRAKSEREIKERFQKLMALRSTSARLLSDRQARYWSFWYYPAVRLAMLTFEFRGDFADLARRLSPAISMKQAQEAVQVLQEMALVRKEDSGIYTVLDAHISTQDAWQSLAIREFQEQTLTLAAESLKRHSPDIREVSTMTLAIPAKEIPTLQEMVREFRRQVAQWTLGLEDSDCVIQADFALFPVVWNQEPDVASKRRRT
jgi:uncharacterized protein (TIGR02147 family)